MNSSACNNEMSSDEDFVITYARKKRATSVSEKSDSAAVEENKDMKKRPIGEDGSYYECEICDDGGELLCCDKCPRAFHLECLGLRYVPRGIWKCPSCREENENSAKPLKRLRKADSDSKKGKSPNKKVKFATPLVSENKDA